MPGLSGRGHRPCHGAALPLDQPGATAPGQRPTRPWRALRPRRVGRWPLLVPDLPIYRGPFRAGGGNAGRVSGSRPEGRSPGCPVSQAGAIAPATALRWDQDRPGAKAPGQRPTRRALLARRVGRWPFVVPGPTDLQGTVPRGRGKRGSRFPFPPGGVFSGMPGLSGRGHRPCHDAALGSGPTGGQSPRPAPDPPVAGASHPPGRALAFRGVWTDRSPGHRPARAGETRCVSWSRPERRRHFHRFNGRGHRPCHSAALGSEPVGGQSPRPAPDPPPAGASRPPGRALAYRGA